MAGSSSWVGASLDSAEGSSDVSVSVSVSAIRRSGWCRLAVLHVIDDGTDEKL
jgi:hypothetical protein